MSSASSSHVMRSALVGGGGRALKQKKPGGGGGVVAASQQKMMLMTWAPDRRLPHVTKVGNLLSVRSKTRTSSSAYSSSSSSFSSLAALPPSAADNALAYGATTYVPSPMDYSALQSQLVVLGAIGIMTAYWWYVLVPGARVNLAVNKRSGKLRDYLEELKGDDDRKLERFFYQKWLAKVCVEPLALFFCHRIYFLWSNPIQTSMNDIKGLYTLLGLGHDDDGKFQTYRV